jgi:acyl transferase domain-containing protein
VPGEGVGAVLLKPLAKAVADGDQIHGVIKASSLNHGGKTNGYTVPNSKSQTEVILQALQRAKIDPRTVTYIEAHGTGTVLGDPIEIVGLQQAFAEAIGQKLEPVDLPDAKRQYCAIGSVKSNIGYQSAVAVETREIGSFTSHGNRESEHPIW